MKRTRIAVIGVGHLGRSHARILKEMPEADLVAVVDADPDRLAKSVERLGVPGVADFRQVPGDPEAVSVVVPTVAHREVAEWFLARGVDVLVEKPMTVTLDDADLLIDLAGRHGRILQVGHVERFNPAVKAVRELGIVPRYIEADRLAPFSFRSIESGVVLDLMIHDIDLVLSFFNEPIESVEAFGGALFTPALDMVNAVLKFRGGRVAHLRANRVALKVMRRMRMFSADSYVSMDFGDKKGLVIRKASDWAVRELDVSTLDLGNVTDLKRLVFEGLLNVREVATEEGDALRAELSAFLACCRDRTPPPVGGREGRAALAVAWRVIESAEGHKW